MFYLKQVKQ